MGEIMLHGDCLVNRAAELRQLFLHHLASGDDRVEIDLSTTTRCDLTFFQLICSVSRSFSQHDKQLVLRGELPPSVTAPFEKAGLVPSCSRCEYGQCLLKQAVTERTAS